MLPMRYPKQRFENHPAEETVMSSKTQQLIRTPQTVALAGFAFASVIVTLCGCSTRNDIHFNPYRAPDTSPTIMQRADQIMDAAGDLLDNLDRRMENVIR